MEQLYKHKMLNFQTSQTTHQGEGTDTEERIIVQNPARGGESASDTQGEESSQGLSIPVTHCDSVGASDENFQAEP